MRYGLRRRSLRDVERRHVEQMLREGASIFQLLNDLMVLEDCAGRLKTKSRVKPETMTAVDTRSRGYDLSAKPSGTTHCFVHPRERN